MTDQVRSVAADLLAAVDSAASVKRGDFYHERKALRVALAPLPEEPARPTEAVLRPISERASELLRRINQARGWHTTDVAMNALLEDSAEIIRDAAADAWQEVGEMFGCPIGTSIEAHAAKVRAILSPTTQPIDAVEKGAG
jgi:hypothetical protein